MITVVHFTKCVTGIPDSLLFFIRNGKNVIFQIKKNNFNERNVHQKTNKTKKRGLARQFR